VQNKIFNFQFSIFNFRKGFLTLWLILVMAIVAVIAIVVFGVLDLGKLKESLPGYSPAPVVQDSQVKSLQKLSSSDEIVDVEKDLNDTNLNNLDQELPQVDQALNEF